MQDNDMISRRALLAAYDAAHKGPPGGARRLIEEAPGVDAVPVVHGRWEYCGDDDLMCSKCGERYYKPWLLQSYYTGPGSDKMDGFWYCPHCGAIMDGEASTCGPAYCDLEADDE